MRDAGHVLGSLQPKVVVLHSTESHDRPGKADVTGIFEYFLSPACVLKNGHLNVHAVVDGQGNIGRGASGNEKCAHALGANHFALGVEQIGFAHYTVADWMRPSRRPQLLAVAKLLAFWSLRWGIPLRWSTTYGVALHRDFPAGGHWDPGYGYPKTWVMSRARRFKKHGW